jgi:hypothetical protein
MKIHARAPMVALALLAGASFAADPYEPLPKLSASDFLDEAQLRGPHHTVEPAVRSDGYWNTYTITSRFGTFEAHGTPQVPVLVREIGALAELEEVNRAAVAAGALADSVGDMAKGAAHAASKPKETAEGVGDGVKRLFGRLGRTARRTAEKGQEAVEERGEEKDPSEPQKDAGEKVAGASVAVAKSLFGVNRARREWARRLGVDPYTRNAVLFRELEAVAKYDAAGRFAKNLVPLGTLGAIAGTAADVDELVWSKDPDEIQTLNEQRLKAMGVPGDVSRHFRLSDAYTLTTVTRLVAALSALEGVPGRAELIARAAEAEDVSQARFHEESGVLAEAFHRREAPVTRLLPDMPALAVLARGRVVYLLPVDYLVWTEDLARDVAEAATRARRENALARREIWLTGRASERTRSELRDRGFELREGALGPTSSPSPAPGRS